MKENIRSNFFDSRVWAGTKTVMALGALCAGGLALLNHPNYLKEELAFQPKTARSSNLLVDGFNDLEVAGEILGATFILKRGLNNLRFSLDGRERALNSLSPNQQSYKFVKNISVTTLMTFSAVMVGNYLGVAHNVSHTQSNVANTLTDLGPKEAGLTTDILSSSPHPDILNETTIPSDGLQDLNRINIQNNLHVELIPIEKQWISAHRNNSTSSYELLALGVPEKTLDLNQSCEIVPVAVSNTFGVPVKGTFQADGLTMRVTEELKNSTGFDLQTVILNQDLFNRCLDESSKGLFYNLIVAIGKDKDLKDLIDLYRQQYPNPEDRINLTTAHDFIQNALQTGENAVDGLVLEAIVIGFIFSDIALAYKIKNDLVQLRKSNLFIKANGFLDKDISKMYRYFLEKNLFQSGLFALPITLIVDSLANIGEPGAKIGLSLKIYLATLGLSWAFSSIASKYYLIKEKKYTYDNVMMEG